MAFTPLTRTPNYGTLIAHPPTPVPASLADSTTWNSDLMPAGFGGVLFGLKSNHVVTLNIQRYADLSGTVPAGPVATQALTANVAGYVGVADGLPFLSWNAQIVNASGSAATLTNSAFLTGPTT